MALQVAALLGDPNLRVGLLSLQGYLQPFGGFPKERKKDRKLIPVLGQIQKSLAFVWAMEILVRKCEEGASFLGQIVGL